MTLINVYNTGHSHLDTSTFVSSFIIVTHMYGVMLTYIAKFYTWILYYIKPTEIERNRKYKTTKVLHLWFLQQDWNIIAV